MNWKAPKQQPSLKVSDLENAANRQFLGYMSACDTYGSAQKPKLYYELIRFDWNHRVWLYYRGRPEEGDSRKLLAWHELPGFSEVEIPK